MRGWIAAACLVAGCNTPGHMMDGVQPQRFDIAPHRYDLRKRGDYMQVMRVDFAFNPRIEVVAAGAERAARMATGCDVAWLRGDVAVMLAGLACNGQKAPKPPKRGKTDVLFCDLRRGGGPVVLDCAP